MKLKEFLKKNGFWQHVVCFLLYALQVALLLILMEIFPDHGDLVIGGTTIVFFPVTFWMFYLLGSDIMAIGRWLGERIIPEKWRKKKPVQPKQIKKSPIKQADPKETEIFCMWDDAIVWKDDRLQLRKKGEYTPITLEQAREQERGYHRYQMSMDVNRGGLPDEVAQRARGFDSDGNYVGGYAVDEFWKKNFGRVEAEKTAAVPAQKPAAEPTVKCYRCGEELKENQQHKRGSGVCCLDCFKELEASAKKRDHESRKAMWETKQYHKERFQKQAEQTEHVIFPMWDDAIVWKDGQLQMRKNGEYTPITLEQARERERSYYGYQMYMDIQRGGADPEVARKSRGFDQNGNFVRGYEVDRFWTQRFGYVPQDEQGITVTRCMRCGKKLDEPVKAKSDSYIRCKECLGDWGKVPVSEKKPAEIKCARCGKLVKRDEATVREGAAYCASCASRLKIKQKDKQKELRCEGCGKKLKAGEAVSRAGAHYCKKCGDMPDAALDQPVFQTPNWSVVWNDGKLYKYEKHGGYGRIALYQARELEREHMLGMWRSCIERGMLSEEKANEIYRIKDGKYTGPYAVDAMTDGRQGTAICSLHADSVIWKAGGVHHLRSTGECLPITMDEARKLEFDYWNNAAAWAYRAGEVKMYEEAQGRIKETKDGWRLKEYAVDEFMRKRQTAGVRSDAADDQPCAKICDLYQGELIWKGNGLYYQKNRGECTPVTREEAQELERGYWSYDSDHIDRMGASMEHVQQVRGFDEDGNRTRPYAVDEFMKRRAEAVCTRCGAGHCAPLEDLIAPDFGCKTCGNPVRIRKVSKKFSPTDIVADGLVYRKVPAGMILIGVEVGAKAAVVHDSIDGHPLVRVDKHAFEDCNPDLKLTFAPGFRMEVKWSDYKPDTKIQFLPKLPGFTGERAMEIGNYHGPDLVREYLYYSEDHSQTVRERFEYHGFDAVYTVVLE